MLEAQIISFFLIFLLWRAQLQSCGDSGATVVLDPEHPWPSVLLPQRADGLRKFAHEAVLRHRWFGGLSEGEAFHFAEALRESQKAERDLREKTAGGGDVRHLSLVFFPLPT